jgi:hypothetical protein
MAISVLARGAAAAILRMLRYERYDSKYSASEACQNETMISATEYAGWPHCYRLTNGEVEVVVTTDVGPRVIRCGFAGGQNLFKEFRDQLGKSGEPDWQPRGGHRLWLAPESVDLSYGLDNSPVGAAIEGDSITLI